MLYWYRVFAKIFCFACFGAGAALLLTPMLYVFPRQQRKLVSFLFRIFIHIMRTVGVISLSMENREKLHGLSGKIVASNHNSILDVVLLIALIPNADCIVKNTLCKRHIFSGITSKIYIPNSLEFSELSARVSESLNKGNNLIIFPEGSRVSEGQTSVFKKGTARFAIEHGCDIVPVRFEGNEKIGLRKGDKMLSFHPTEKYSFHLRVMPAISMEQYKNMPVKAATEKLTDNLKEILIS